MIDILGGTKFNFKMFISSYRDIVGHDTKPEDWNVRIREDEIVIDNSRNENTSTFVIEDNVLFVSVRSWNSQKFEVSSQNIDLTNTNFGWRDASLKPIRNPDFEAIAFFEHIKKISSSSKLGAEDMDSLAYSGMHVSYFDDFSY